MEKKINMTQTNNKQKSKRIYAAITDDLYQKVYSVAQSEGYSMSSYLRHLIMVDLNNRSK